MILGDEVPRNKLLPLPPRFTMLCLVFSPGRGRRERTEGGDGGRGRRKQTEPTKGAGTENVGNGRQLLLPVSAGRSSIGGRVVANCVTKHPQNKQTQTKKGKGRKGEPETKQEANTTHETLPLETLFCFALDLQASAPRVCVLLCPSYKASGPPVNVWYDCVGGGLESCSGIDPQTALRIHPPLCHPYTT